MRLLPEVVQRDEASLRHFIESLFALAVEPLRGDDTDRAERITSAIAELENLGVLADLEVSVTVFSLVYHVADGFQQLPTVKARRRGRASRVGDQLLRDRAQMLGHGKPPTAATARDILPALLIERNRLRADGISTPNLSSERGIRTVSSWLKKTPSVD